MSKTDSDVKRVLKDDGVEFSILEEGHNLENISTTSINHIEKITKNKGIPRVLLKDPIRIIFIY